MDIDIGKGKEEGNKWGNEMVVDEVKMYHCPTEWISTDWWDCIVETEFGKGGGQDIWWRVLVW